MLDDIIRRWMQGDVRPGDEESIAQLIKFNNLFVLRYLRILAESIFQKRLDKRIFRNISRKGDLKDVLVKNPFYRNERIDLLINEYLHHSGIPYRGKPFHDVLVCQWDGKGFRYAGSYLTWQPELLIQST